MNQIKPLPLPTIYRRPSYAHTTRHAKPPRIVIVAHCVNSSHLRTNKRIAALKEQIRKSQSRREIKRLTRLLAIYQNRMIKKSERLNSLSPVFGCSPVRVCVGALLPTPTIAA